MKRKKRDVKPQNGSGGTAWRQSARTEAASAGRPLWLHALVDALLLLIVAAGILSIFAVLAASAEDTRRGERRTVQYTLEISDIRPEFAGYAKPGMTVTDFNTDDVLGTVDTVEIVDRADAREGKVLVLTLTAETRYLPEEGYFIGSFRVAMGNCAEVRFERIYGVARCVDVTVKE